AEPPRSRAISSARIFSRSRATRLMRSRISDLTMKLEPKVNTTAAAEMAARTEIRNSRLLSSATMFTGSLLVLELDHLAHDEHTGREHDDADAEPDMAQRAGEERQQIGRG